MVREESGHTTDKSPYFTAFRVVIAPAALHILEKISTPNIGMEIS